MTMQTKRRPGLTRLELAVLLLIAAVFLGLIFTFVDKQREKANRLTCANNLKRIGQATLGFHEDRKFLPSVRIAPGYATWAVEIVPHLDKDSGLVEWDLSRPFAAQAAKVREAVLTAYFCPARNRSSWLSAAGEGPDHDPLPGALGDYACASGDGDPARPWTGADANGAIILGEVLEEKGGLLLRWQSRTSLASLVRGQSYTILAGEKHVPLDQLGQTKVGDGSLYNGAVPESSGRIGGPGYGLAPSPLAPFNTNFGSAHVGICQLLKADGSVQAYDVSISEDLLGKMVRRD
jgi:hypothetical protein